MNLRAIALVALSACLALPASSVAQKTSTTERAVTVALPERVFNYTTAPLAMPLTETEIEKAVKATDQFNWPNSSPPEPGQPKATQVIWWRGGYTYSAPGVYAFNGNQRLLVVLNGQRYEVYKVGRIN